MVLLNKLKRSLFDLINGLRSGIPLCCTVHYVSSKWRGVCGIAKHDSERRGFPWKRRDLRPEFYQKVRYCLCDKCFANESVVKIKHNGTIFKCLMRKKKKYERKG
jgi:hypothetical protein